MPNTRGANFDHPATVQVPPGKKYILGIGINAYTGWRPLRNATRDVEAIVRVLHEQYDFDDATLLMNAEATRDGIEEALYHFTDPLVLGEHDSLLIYYSGHGHLDRNGRGYWVPVNAEMGRITSYLPNSRIRELISDFCGRHVLLISDSCFSGAFFTRGGAPDHAAATEYERRGSRWAFCSGRHDEEVSDGDAGGNSPFATAILQELSLNEAAKLNIARLADKVIEITRASYPQMPEANPIQGAGHLGGQFVFTLKGAAPEPAPENDLERTALVATYRNGGSEPASERERSALRQPVPPGAPEPPVAAGLSAGEIGMLKRELQELVGKGRSEQALKQLKTLSEAHFPALTDDVFSLTARWDQLRRQDMMGMLGFSEANMERNKINGAILGIISGGLE